MLHPRQIYKYTGPLLHRSRGAGESLKSQTVLAVECHIEPRLKVLGATNLFGAGDRCLGDTEIGLLSVYLYSAVIIRP
jgi:hypothetical protein